MFARLPGEARLNEMWSRGYSDIQARAIHPGIETITSKVWLSKVELYLPGQVIIPTLREDDAGPELVVAPVKPLLG